MKYNSLFESLDSKVGSEVTVRRYNLSDMISESYKALYNCERGTNMYKLAEAHLNDVRNNPRDIDRLSRQLSIVKEISRLTESGELEDKDLLVPKESQDQVDPKKERALDLKESAAPYTWGDWQRERGSSCRVKYYSSGMDLTNQIIGIVYEETPDHPYYGAEIYDNSTSSTIEDRSDDSYHFDTEKEAIEWVEEWFSKEMHESKDDEDVEETEDEDLLEDTNLTDEEVEELTKHLKEIRKDKKVAECDSPIKAKPRRSQKVSEAVEVSRSWDADWITIPGESCRVKYYFDHSQSDKDQIIGTIYEPNGREFDTYGADIYNNKTEDFLSGTGIDIEDFVSEIAAKKWVESWFSKNMNECDAPKTPVKETTKPRRLKRARESAPILSRYHIVNPEGETIDSYTDRKDAEDWVNQLYKDGDYKKGDLKVIDSQAKNESNTYESLNLSEFGKKSSSKAFVKTFKKMQNKLKEGTALTRQESISLYKAANSAMTHLSVELEHNPEFLDTFKESVELLSADVNRLLGSLKEGKAPSKKTMKSLAKFTESLLRESHSIEDITMDSYNHFTNDLGRTPSVDDVMEDMLSNYNIEGYSDSTPAEASKLYNKIESILHQHKVEINEAEDSRETLRSRLQQQVKSEISRYGNTTTDTRLSIEDCGFKLDGDKVVEDPDAQERARRATSSIKEAETPDDTYEGEYNGAKIKITADGPAGRACYVDGKLFYMDGGPVDKVLSDLKQNIDHPERMEEAVEDEEDKFVSDEEGEIGSEEEEDFDQEYADARVELHKELADDHADSEDPGVQEKLSQDAEEVVNLPGITDDQIAEITGEETTEEDPAPEAETDTEETPEETPEEQEDDSEITDDELAELKRHLVEMRKSKKSK